MIHAFHIDTKKSLSPGIFIQNELGSPSTFGRKQIAEFHRLGIAEPRIGPVRESHESIRRLPAIALREYVAELARQIRTLNNERQALVSRLNAAFACDSYEGALRIAKKLRLPAELSIYTVKIEGNPSRHDMSWLDGRFETIDGGIDRCIRYWSGERVEQHKNLVELGHESLIELVVDGRMTIGEIAGKTTV